MSFSASTSEAFATLARAADCLRAVDPHHPLLWEFDRLPELHARWHALEKKWPRVFAGTHHRECEHQVFEALSDYRTFAERLASAAEAHFPAECAAEAKRAAETISAAARCRLQQIKGIPEDLADLRATHVRAIQDLARISQTQLREHEYAEAAAALEQLMVEVTGQLDQVRAFMEKEPIEI